MCGTTLFPSNSNHTKNLQVLLFHKYQKKNTTVICPFILLQYTSGETRICDNIKLKQQNNQQVQFDVFLFLMLCYKRTTHALKLVQHNRSEIHNSMHWHSLFRNCLHQQLPQLQHQHNVQSENFRTQFKLALI